MSNATDSPNVNPGSCGYEFIDAMSNLQELANHFKTSFKGCNDYARAALRAVFHDAGTWDRFKQTGGLDGSLLYELDRVENFGTELAINNYLPLMKIFKLSLADLIAFGGKWAVDVCGGPRVFVLPGRRDASVANEPGLLPGSSASVDQIIKVFVERMGFTLEEMVACIGYLIL
jgi:L-ascorbate peroxidase